MYSSRFGNNIHGRKTILRIAILVIIAFYGQQFYSQRTADSTTDADKSNRVNQQSPIKGPLAPAMATQPA